jgi:5-methylcytosine-specific restriction endonuclease McrA
MSKRRRYSEAQRRLIYDRTRGKCHICHIKLAFRNYGQCEARGAWHVEHSIPVANGGTDHGNNLFAACIPCNLDKSTATSRTARSWNGQQRAPLSKSRHEVARTNNRITVGMIGAGLGAVFGGPSGAFIGGLLGTAIGEGMDPDDP